MELQKWNPKKKEYEPYNVPDDWHVSGYETNMEKTVNCAQCGKPIAFGDGYTSMEVQHKNFGIGYAVCCDCYAKEWERRKLYG